MTNCKYVDIDGVENVAVGIIKQTKKDFIKGAKVLYSHMNCIPEEKELFNDTNPKHKFLASHADVRWMYDAWRFVKHDPYQLFGEPGEESVINSWKRQAIVEYYRGLYLKGAVMLYKAHATKYIHKLDESEITNIIKDAQTANDFISARNYIVSNLPKVEVKEIFKEWNILAFARIRVGKGNGRIPINNTKFFKEKKAERVKNIKKAKELFDEGKSIKDIADEMELSVCTIRNYLKS